MELGNQLLYFTVDFEANSRFVRLVASMADEASTSRVSKNVSLQISKQLC